MCCVSLLLLAILSCQAFAPSSSLNDSLNRNCYPSSSRLPASSTSINDAKNNYDIDDSSKRSFLLSSSTSLTTSLLSVLTSSPLVTNAAEEAAFATTSSSSKLKPLSTYLYLILRVREATEQESRLISTGKFKDIQRANVKLAIKFMINNYKLSDSIIGEVCISV